MADKTTSPFWQFYSIGFGGKGAIPTRGRDQWGIGYYYLRFSNDITKALRDRISLDHEQGVELFYNFEVLPWVHLTPDLQIIMPSRMEILAPNKNIDSSVVAGFRIKIDF